MVWLIFSWQKSVEKANQCQPHQAICLNFAVLFELFPALYNFYGLMVKNMLPLSLLPFCEKKKVGLLFMGTSCKTVGLGVFGAKTGYF